MHEPVGIGKGPLGGLGNQVIARSEVLVEAAVRQPGRLHDLRDRRPIQALLADPLRGDVHDALVCLGFFLS